jgi:hypothetical protein
VGRFRLYRAILLVSAIRKINKVDAKALLLLTDWRLLLTTNLHLGFKGGQGSPPGTHLQLLYNMQHREILLFHLVLA